MTTLPPIADEFTPSFEDWAEFAAWADSFPDPEPTPEDFAWHDGYTAGRAGDHEGPIGLVGTVRDAWWAGFTAGFAASSAARADAIAATGLVPPDVAEWIAATSTVTCDPARDRLAVLACR